MAQGAGHEAVDARERASDREGEDEFGSAPFERIHQHH